MTAREDDQKREPDKATSGGTENAGGSNGTTINAKSETVRMQQNSANITNQFFNGETAPGGPAAEQKRLEDLPESLPSLAPGLHRFRDPQHDRILSELERRRILILASYQQTAAYAAAYTLVGDAQFDSRTKRALSPAGNRLKERSDLDIVSLTEEGILSDPQVILIDIGRQCTFLGSVLTLALGDAGKIHDRLVDQSSYLVLAVDEELLRDAASLESAKRWFAVHSVSHLHYLFRTPQAAARVQHLEARLLDSVDRGAWQMDRKELYQRVADLLTKEPAELEAFVEELEQARGLTRSVWIERFQPIRPEEVVKEGSETHRVAAYIATYIPELGQREFDRFAKLLLGNATATVERERQRVGDDGVVRIVREVHEESWLERWKLHADDVFEDCYLHPIATRDGFPVIDFSEPYLRREVRAYFERRRVWYLLDQCQKLQASGIFFAPNLSQAAIDGLVRLFVDRALVDPEDGVGWLVGLIMSVQTQVSGTLPEGSPEEQLTWIIGKLAAEAQLRAHFHGRVALLIRAMLDHEPLRPQVRGFFDFLMASGRHDAVLDVVLDLARRLRFAPHFDPLEWMRRLLDQGAKETRERTADRLLGLAAHSGPQVYAFLAAVRRWLPAADRSPEQFSPSNEFALDFPFDLCLHIAGRLSWDQFGVWPTRHPLLAALPNDREAARAEIGNVIDWLLDPRGASLEQADAGEPLRTAPVLRMERVADLIEHWAWVLEGGAATGPAEGRALFDLVLQELARRGSALEHLWLQRSWARRRHDYMSFAVQATAGVARITLVQRQAKLDEVRTRFALLATEQRRASV
jgi:hypothetical protein